MQRCNRPLTQIFIGVAIAVFFTGENHAQEETEWKKRFFAEAPKRWEDYLHFARSLQVSVTATLYKGANRASEKQVRSEFKQTKGASLHVRQVLGSNGESAEAEGTNPSYSFKLKRRSPDRGWIITDLKLPEATTSLSDEQRGHQEMQLQTICGCLMLENLWLPTLIHDPDFRITAIKFQEIDGRPVVRFDFDYVKPGKVYPVEGAVRLKGGWMVVDPEHDWILRDYQVHTGNPEESFIRKTFQIREGTGRHPIITGGTVHTVGKGEKSFESLVEAQQEVVEQSNVSLEEFTLSAFGLPEPPGTQVGGTQVGGGSRLYLWFALGGFICLGIGVLIRRQLRRTKLSS